MSTESSYLSRISDISTCYSSTRIYVLVINFCWTPEIMHGKLKSVVLLLQPLCRLCGANARITSKGDTYVHEQLFLVFAPSEFLVIQTCTGERCASRFRTRW